MSSPHPPMWRENNTSTQNDWWVSEECGVFIQSTGLCPQWCEDKKFGGLRVDFGRWWVFLQAGGGIKRSRDWRREKKNDQGKHCCDRSLEFVDSYTVGGLIGLISHPITSIIPANVIFDFNVEYWPGRCQCQLRMKRRNMIGLRWPRGMCHHHGGWSLGQCLVDITETRWSGPCDGETLSYEWCKYSSPSW